MLNDRSTHNIFHCIADVNNLQIRHVACPSYFLVRGSTNLQLSIIYALEISNWHNKCGSPLTLCCYTVLIVTMEQEIYNILA